MESRGGMRRYMVPAVIAYVVATTAFLVWRGISVSPDYFVFILLLGAVVLGRWKAFIVDWAPFILLFLGYEFLRGFAGRTGIAPHYTEVIAADHVVGLGTLPTLALQAWFYRGGGPSALDVVCTLFYFLHFAYPLTLGYAFWIRDRGLFRRFALTLLAMSFAAFVFFLLVPVAPPWLASEQGLIPHVEKIISHTLPSSTDVIYKSMTPNKVAAFPSLHTAFPFLGMLYGVRLFGARAVVPLGAWVLAVIFSIVYLGEHYLVDALGGLVLAAACFGVVEWLAARRRKDPGQGGSRLQRDRPPR
ncbi:MAG: phosphatase PAP2 family protein [Candidatus Dormibacteria bacterium]